MRTIATLWRANKCADCFASPEHRLAGDAQAKFGGVVVNEAANPISQSRIVANFPLQRNACVACPVNQGPLHGRFTIARL